MTKNGIRIKKQFKQQFLAVCFKCGLKPKSSKVVEPNHITYTIQFNHIQQVFNAGYYFSKFI